MSSLANLRDQADDGGDDKSKSKSSKPSSRETSTPNMYCLDNAHSPRLVSEERFFYWDPQDTSCPTCPVCRKQVNAQGVGYNAKGQPQIPEGVLSLAHRIGEPV